MRCLVLISLLLPGVLTAQPQILHFTRTSGFDHGTREVSFAMFQSIAQEVGAVVVDDQTGDPFSDPIALANYAVIVFSNTSGDDLLDAAQRTCFETWVANGGRVLGIHAATDTYRHSTANGNNTGTWDFYAELIGASVQEGPNHVAGTPTYLLMHIGTHPSTSGLPDPWLKNEEYYYWENGYYRPDNVEVLRVEGTVGPNGLVNSYDAPRPMSWYRELPNGTRVFCTALGHAGSNFTSDQLFRTHIRDALIWLLEGHTAMADLGPSVGVRVLPNPASDLLTVATDDAFIGGLIHVLDATGRIVLRAATTGERTTIPIGPLATGTYVVRAAGATVPVQVVR